MFEIEPIYWGRCNPQQYKVIFINPLAIPNSSEPTFAIGTVETIKEAKEAAVNWLNSKLKD